MGWRQCAELDVAQLWHWESPLTREVRAMLTTIEEALERVRAIQPATRPAIIEACPCGCIPPNMRAAFDTITRTSGAVHPTAFYAFKAMTTWGDAAAYAYFLPRILELSLTEEGRGYPGLGWSLIGRKLAMAEVHRWPEADRGAILDFFCTIADRHRATAAVDARFDPLGTEALAYPLCDVFVPVHVLAGSLRPVLGPWEESDRLSDWLSFAGLVVQGVPLALRHGTLGGPELRAWVWDRRALLDDRVDRWIDEEPAVFCLAEAQDAFTSGRAEALWAFE